MTTIDTTRLESALKACEREPLPGIVGRIVTEAAREYLDHHEQILPVPPEGWRYKTIYWNDYTDIWGCDMWEIGAEGRIFVGNGPTPRAASQAALDKIGGQS